MPFLTLEKASVHVYLGPPYCDVSKKTGPEPLGCERWHGLTLTGTWCLDPAFNSRRIYSRLGDVCFNAHISICIYLYIYILFTHIYIYIHLYVTSSSSSHKIHQKKPRGPSHRLKKTCWWCKNLRVFKQKQPRRKGNVMWFSSARLGRVWGCLWIPGFSSQLDPMYGRYGLLNYKILGSFFRVFSC